MNGPLQITTLEELTALPVGTALLDCDGERMRKISRFGLFDEGEQFWTVEEAMSDCAPFTILGQATS